MNFNPEEHYHNRNQVPEQELERFYGQHVAWSLDGKRIIASSADPAHLIDAVRAAGGTAETVVLSYVPQPDEIFFGGLQAGDWEATG